MLIGLIAVALAFDFLNGLHDAANSIATIVSTRVLRPRYAVVWAAFFNFIAFLFFGLHVAKTIGKGIVAVAAGRRRGDLRRADGRDRLERRHLAGRASRPHPSHALIGGLVGAGVAKAGLRGDRLERRRQDRARGIVVSPAFGFVLALLLVLIVSWLFVRATPLAVDRSLPQAAVRLRLALLARPRRQRRAEDHGDHRRAALRPRECLGALPRAAWVVLSCQAAMALGTLIGGWRIVHTMGSKITRLTPDAGLLRRDRRRDHPVPRHLPRRAGLHHPHHHRRHRRRRRRAATVGGALERGASIVVAWVITMPAAALVGALFYGLARLF